MPASFYFSENSCTVCCFAPTVLYAAYDRFLLVTLCLALSSLCGQMGTTITSFHPHSCDKVLTRPQK